MAGVLERRRKEYDHTLPLDGDKWDIKHHNARYGKSVPLKDLNLDERHMRKQQMEIDKLVAENQKTLDGTSQKERDDMFYAGGSGEMARPKPKKKKKRRRRSSYSTYSSSSSSPSSDSSQSESDSETESESDEK